MYLKMEKKIFLYAFGMWFIFVIAAILNGTFRNAFITPKLGEHAGHIISTVILICVILAGTCLFLANLKIDYTNNILFSIGLLWLILTILFEFVFGHYVMGNSWSTLIADYNILKGRVWGLFLIALFISPYLCGLLLRK